jgi:transcription termination factor Rho
VNEAESEMNLQCVRKKRLLFNKSAYEKKIALKKDKEEAKELNKETEEVVANDAAETQEVAAPVKKVNPNQLNKQNQTQILKVRKVILGILI